MGLRHVLLEVAAEGHVDQLPAAAHGQQRYAGVEGPPGDGEVEGVLLVVDVVDRGIGDLLAVQRGRDVAPARQQDAVGEGQAPPDLLDETTPSGAQGWTVSGSPPARSTPSDSERAVLRAR